MTKEEKNQVIENMSVKLTENPHFYLADVSALTVEDSNSLRGIFHEQGIRIEVVKNTLLKKAMEKTEKDYSEMYEILVGNTSIIFTETGNAPAKLIKQFRKDHPKPLLKAAFVEESVYLGDNQLDALAALKSKTELIAEVIGLLQSPIQNLVGALQSSGGTLAGIIKTLSEKEN